MINNNEETEESKFLTNDEITISSGGNYKIYLGISSKDDNYAYWDIYQVVFN